MQLRSMPPWFTLLIVGAASPFGGAGSAVAQSNAARFDGSWGLAVVTERGASAQLPPKACLER